MASDRRGTRFRDDARLPTGADRVARSAQGAGVSCVG